MPASSLESGAMAAEPKPIKITPSIRIVDLLERADKAPLVLEQNGVRYRLSREDEAPHEDEDLWADYDPEEFIEALNAAAGSWADLDADALVQDIYRWRREGSRPADRPSWPT
jgi:hypothetical protein